MLPTKFWFIWPSGFRGEDFKKSANQKQELPVVAMFVNKLYFDFFISINIIKSVETRIEYDKKLSKLLGI